MTFTVRTVSTFKNGQCTRRHVSRAGLVTLPRSYLTIFEKNEAVQGNVMNKATATAVMG